jgi:hypothetical protein
MEVLSQAPELQIGQSASSQSTFDFKESRVNEMSTILKEHREKRAKECEEVKKRLAFNCFFALTGTPAPRQEVDDCRRYWTNERIEAWSMQAREESCQKKGLSSDSGISLTSQLSDHEGGSHDVIIRGEERRILRCKPSSSTRPLNRPVLCTFHPIRSASASHVRGSLTSDEGIEVVRLHLVEKSNWAVSPYCSSDDGLTKRQTRPKAGKFYALH